MRRLLIMSGALMMASASFAVVEHTKDTVIEAARKLGCDAVLLPSILGSTAKDHWNVWTEYDTGKTHQSDAKSVMSAVQVLIIGLDGKLLMKGEEGDPVNDDRQDADKADVHAVTQRLSVLLNPLAVLEFRDLQWRYLNRASPRLPELEEPWL